MTSVEHWLERFFHHRPHSRLLVANCANQLSDARLLGLGGFAPLSGAMLPLRLYTPVCLGAWDNTKHAYELSPRKSYSQASQDLFVRRVLRGKSKGIFVDVGSAHPFDTNNTYLLERDLGWSGLAVDQNPKLVDLFRRCRRSPCIAVDATQFDFLSWFRAQGWPKQLDYLSLDVEPSEQTFSCLRHLVSGEFRYSVVTFEHEMYREGPVTRDSARDLMHSMGYQLVVSDVSCNGCTFEDWFVDPTTVPSDVWGKFVRDSVDHTVAVVPQEIGVEENE